MEASGLWFQKIYIDIYWICTIKIYIDVKLWVIEVFRIPILQFQDYETWVFDILHRV